jgi:ketosteroid isomerase-like protein
MKAQENKAIARRFVEALQGFFRTGDADLVDSVLAENVVQHISGMPPEAQSLEGFKQLLPTLRQAFPDTLFDVEDLVAEGDKVAECYPSRRIVRHPSDRQSGDGDGGAHLAHRRWQGRGALGRMGCPGHDAAARRDP